VRISERVVFAAGQEGGVEAGRAYRASFEDKVLMSGMNFVGFEDNG